MAEPRKIVAQVTKQGFTYVFDRVTGDPIWPIVERPVPQSDVPGEKTAATQPFPTKPAPFDRQGVTENDLIDFTPELKAEAVRIASQFKMGPIYTPPIVTGTGGKLATLTVPHNQGAANWQSAAADPETGILYVPSVTNWWASALAEGGHALRHEIRRAQHAGRTAAGPAADQATMGTDHRHRYEHGRITCGWSPTDKAPDYVKNHPALAGIDLSGVGNPERAPLLVTKTLLFSGDGAGLFSSGPQGGGKKFRALDKKTGKTLFEMELPGNETGLADDVHGRRKAIHRRGGRARGISRRSWSRWRCRREEIPSSLCWNCWRNKDTCDENSSAAAHVAVTYHHLGISTSSNADGRGR